TLHLFNNILYTENVLANQVTHDVNPKRSISGISVDQKPVYPQFVCEHSHDGKKKRTEFGQLFHILEYIWSSDDTKISSISRSNNMSHDAATRNCEKLVSVGLVTREVTYDAKRYRLTSQGRSFLTDCRNFGDILCRYNLCHTLYC